ncbi:reverse transcriptase domain-containing protein [Tanacetum coccineum]
MGHVLIPKSEVKGVTTRGGKMTSEATRSKEINETRINKNEPPRFKHDKQEKPHDDSVENKSLSLGEPKPTRMSLELADRLIQYLRGIVKNVLIKVDKLVLPINFVILDMPEDSRILIILGRPFLATARAMINVFNKKITLSVGYDEVIFDMDQSNTETKDKKEAENLVAYHLSRLENPHMEVLTKREIADEFPDEHLMVLRSKFKDDEPWYTTFINYIARKVVPLNWTFKKRKSFFSQVNTYFWEEPYAFKICTDNRIRRCVDGRETLKILEHCHSGPTGGHYSANVTAKKVYEFRYEKPQNNIQVCEVFDLWGLDFIGPFPQSRAYKTLTGCTPFRLVYGKACHLPVEIEHKAHWALKQYNIDFTLSSKSCLMQLNELVELRDDAYENTRIYKERTKKWHDSRLCGDKDFKDPGGKKSTKSGILPQDCPRDNATDADITKSSPQLFDVAIQISTGSFNKSELVPSTWSLPTERLRSSEITFSSWNMKRIMDHAQALEELKLEARLQPFSNTLKGVSSVPFTYFWSNQNVIDEDNTNLSRYGFTYPVHQSLGKSSSPELSTGDDPDLRSYLNKILDLTAGRIGHRSLGVGSGSSLSVCSVPCNRCTSGKTHLSSLQTEPELPRVRNLVL